MTPRPDPAALLPAAMEAVGVAARMMRTRRPASVTEKHDRDLVSDVDVAIERTVRGMLEKAAPGIAFLGEEEGPTGGTAGQGWMWAFDPIDGTSNYAHGIPLCASSLALLRDGTPVLGVIDAPFLNQRYHAVEGQGAFTGDQRLSASGTRHLRDAVVAVGDYATGPGAARDNEVRLAVTVQLTPRVQRLRMIGTAALDLAWVGQGRLDASITLGNKPWDTAAGTLIAREAGAAVTDADGTPHSTASAATIAAPPALIDQLILLLYDTWTHATARQEPPAGGPSPSAALDAVLAASRYLIFDFDGVVRDLASVPPAGASGDLPASPAGASADAITGAAPVAYVHEAVAACRDSGRIPAIITTRPAMIVSAWLERYGLTDQIPHVITTDVKQAGSRPGGDLAARAASALGADPAECALITTAPAAVRAARQAGLHAIGYAVAPEASDNLADAGAEAVILSLADLTLRLRARPFTR